SQYHVLGLTAMSTVPPPPPTSSSKIRVGLLPVPPPRNLAFAKSAPLLPKIVNTSRLLTFDAGISEKNQTPADTLSVIIGPRFSVTKDVFVDVRYCRPSEPAPPGYVPPSPHSRPVDVASGLD